MCQEAQVLNTFSEGPLTIVSSTGITQNLAISHGSSQHPAAWGREVQTASQLAHPNWA